MNRQFARTFCAMVACAALLCFARPVVAAEPARLSVDLRAAPRGIIQVDETLPLAPGRVDLVFPKWIPGTHGPNGPIANLVSLSIRSRGQAIPWRRDPHDGYRFILDVPPGKTSLDLHFAHVSEPGSESTAHIAVLNWNEVVLVPASALQREFMIVASVRMPNTWVGASALGDGSSAVTATLERLVDSPFLAAEWMMSVPLASGEPSVRMAIASDVAKPTIDAKVLDHFRTLVAQEQLGFGGRHWQAYTFLVALSDTLGYGGLEHHESSLNTVPQNGLSSEERAKSFAGGLYAHEFAHSWNGKFRRPEGLVRDTFSQAYDDRLLWVYEGLTQYLGDVFAVRSGFLSVDEFATVLANRVARLGAEPGRTSRPLVDTAIASPLSYSARGAWSASLRGGDYYNEGGLAWLEADAIIRRGSNGTKSLDDFLSAFFGGVGPAEVRGYSRADLIAALNAIYPMDWSSFFAERIDRVAPAAPSRGLEAAGWRVVYADAAPDVGRLEPRRSQTVDARYSLGFMSDSGRIVDVLQGSPAATVGIGPGRRIVAVNSALYTDDVLRSAIGGSERHSISLMMEAPGGRFQTFTIEYAGGLRQPKAERTAEIDILSAIGKPR